MNVNGLESSVKTVAISQSNYIPWWGYFYLISQVDVFVFYDCVQFTKNDWRNRNLLSSDSGLHWLTIPVGSSTKRAVNEVFLPRGNWRRKHLNFVKINYSKNRYFEEIYKIYQQVLLDEKVETLSQLNQTLIMDICTQLLHLSTSFLCSSNHQISQTSTQRLVSHVKKLNGGTYISAPAGRNYIEEELFQQNSIKLQFLEYPQDFLARYSAFPQNSGTNLSIIDTYSRFGKNIFFDSGDAK